MSTRHSIWFGESEGKSVHIYWELADREVEDGKIVGVPIYLAVSAGDADDEVTIRLPKTTAIQLLTILSSNFHEEASRVI